MTVPFAPQHTSQVVDGRILCPLCDWSIEIPEPQYAPGVAEVFGMDAATLANIHLHQSARRMENDLERHLSTHPVQAWVIALMQARDRIAKLEASS
jgi:hypothetical protein